MIVMIGIMCQSIFLHSRLSSSAVSTGGGGSVSSPPYASSLDEDGAVEDAFSTITTSMASFSIVSLLKLLDPEDVFVVLVIVVDATPPIRSF